MAASNPVPQYEENVDWNPLVLPDTLAETLTTLCRKLRNWEVLHAEGIQIPERILLYGPPGTGKTAIAAVFARECGLNLVRSLLFECKGQFIGQSEISVKSLFERARARRPCILFVDEFDVSPAAQDSYYQEIVIEFLMALQALKPAEGVFFLAAAIDPAGVDPRLLSRFSERIQLAYPGEDQRRRMLEKMLAPIPKDFDVDVVCTELAAQVGEVCGRELKQLVFRATNDSLERASNAGSIENIILHREDLLRAWERR